VEILEVTAAVQRGRDGWQYRGQQRPSWADVPQPGQESVWDYPRPPIMQSVALPVRVEYNGQLIGHTTSAIRVLETAGAPTYYLPSDHVDAAAVLADDAGRQSLCEWKGVATIYSVAGLANQAWAYHQVFAEFQEIAGWFAFYPTQLQCFVGEDLVQPQPGGYYGGWVTPGLVGPIKGERGSQSW